MKTTLLLFLSLAAALARTHAADSKAAATAVNALGVDLYRTQAHGEDNLLLSPYSIQNALAMTFAGADGDTQAEMQRVLHFPADETALHGSFAALAGELADAAKKTVESVKNSKKNGGPNTPIEFNLANRLFAEKHYEFRAPFLDLVKTQYHAPLEKVDYRSAPEAARAKINRWVEEQTKNKIRDLIPAGVIKADTRLTLVNALYLRAPWSDEFVEGATKNERFLVHGRDGVPVPTMLSGTHCGYAKRDGFQVVTRTYYGGELQFVIVLPDNPAGLAAMEKQLTPKLLEECAHLPSQKVILYLPKFRLEPPTLSLGDSLQALGMKTAFDHPAGSANFDRMAPRQPNDYLYIGAVLHKTFLALDEKGTEAAAATAVVMAPGGAMIPSKPPEVRVDHPFLFAIQHVPSGACLFLGRVTDPR
ncbi:MAG: serpin family protein [Chthoniobacter sp.]|uniref:serpin family protein n=1 Tax=Chthoniobacter sp. TaxID=2510640 RepID=UPI0032AD64D7